MQRLATEENGGEDGEDYQGDNLLHNLQLHKREGASVTYETDAVGGNLARVLGKGDSPREEDYQIQILLLYLVNVH